MRKSFVREVRLIYIRERTAYESTVLQKPYPYKPPALYDEGRAAVTTDSGVLLDPAVKSVWPKLAKFFYDNEIDPVAYIATQFLEAFSAVRRPPEPQALRGQKAQLLWKKALKFKEEEIRIALTVEKNIARSKIAYHQIGGDSRDRACAMTLCDTTLELSPLFRYCLALSLGGLRFERIAKRFETEACIQYYRYRVYYDRYWRGMLPADFTQLSREIYRQSL